MVTQRPKLYFIKERIFVEKRKDEKHPQTSGLRFEEENIGK